MRGAIAGLLASVALLAACLDADADAPEPEHPACADGWVHELELTGPEAPAQTCVESFVLVGRASQLPDQANSWRIEACPCPSLCEDPPIYELRTNFSEPGIEVANIPECIELEIVTGADCETDFVVVRDAQAEALVLATAYRAAAPPGFEDLEVAGVRSAPGCRRQDGELRESFELIFDAGLGELRMTSNEVEVLDTPQGPLEIVLGRAHSGPGSGDGAEPEISYSLRPL